MFAKQSILWLHLPRHIFLSDANVHLGALIGINAPFQALIWVADDYYRDSKTAISSPCYTKEPSQTSEQKSNTFTDSPCPRYKHRHWGKNKLGGKTDSKAIIILNHTKAKQNLRLPRFSRRESHLAKENQKKVLKGSNL